VVFIKENSIVHMYGTSCGGCEYVCPARPFRAAYIEGNSVQQEAMPFIEKKEEVQVDDLGF